MMHYRIGNQNNEQQDWYWHNVLNAKLKLILAKTISGICGQNVLHFCIQKVIDGGFLRIKVCHLCPFKFIII